VRYYTEDDIARSVVRAIHYFAVLSWYGIAVEVMILCGLMVNSGLLSFKAGMTFVCAVAAIMVISLLLMITQLLMHNPKKYKYPPLVQQVIDRSRKTDLTYEPWDWCWRLLQRKRATWLEHMIVWCSLPLIITVTEIERGWRRFCQTLATCYYIRRRK